VLFLIAHNIQIGATEIYTQLKTKNMNYKEWKLLIEKEGRTITWLAKEIGLERGYLSMQIRGKRPMKEETREKLNELLNIEGDD